MRIKWVRGGEDITFNRPHVFFVTGIRGSGKSSFLEHIAECYMLKGHGILDLFASRDGENLAWLRSPHVEDKRVLLVKGDNVDVKCSYDVKHIDTLTLSDFENYDIVISPSPFYLNLDHEYSAAAKITDLLYRRLYYRRLIFCIVREAANLYYSRLKISHNQTQAKSEMIYLIRESRHLGLALGLDSLRWHAIDIDIRSLSDYIVIKNVGQVGLIRELKWLYYYVEPHLLRHITQDKFIILTKRGSIGLGVFPYPKWHKKEKENILREVGIEVEYGEEMHLGEDRGTYRTVSDKEHAEIICLYVDEACSIHDIAELKGRSPRTINVHIRRHNREVEEKGICLACKRANSPYAKIVVKRGGYMYTTEQPQLKASTIIQK